MDISSASSSWASIVVVVEDIRAARATRVATIPNLRSFAFRIFVVSPVLKAVFADLLDPAWPAQRIAAQVTYTPFVASRQGSWLATLRSYAAERALPAAAAEVFAIVARV